MGKFFFVATMLMVSLGCVHAQDDSVQQLEQVQFDNIVIELGGKKYDVEYAKTFEQRARGLMFRKELCEDCGMFFKFNTAKLAGMWMKNTQTDQMMDRRSRYVLSYLMLSYSATRQDIEVS